MQDGKQAAGNRSLELYPEHEIKHNVESRRFELTVSGIISMIEYESSEGILNLTRVHVPYELTGQGLASYMAKHVFNYARENNLKIIPTNTFIKTYIQNHPEYHDLLLRLGNFVNRRTKKYYQYE